MRGKDREKLVVDYSDVFKEFGDTSTRPLPSLDEASIFKDGVRCYLKPT